MAPCHGNLDGDNADAVVGRGLKAFFRADVAQTVLLGRGRRQIVQLARFFALGQPLLEVILLLCYVVFDNTCNFLFSFQALLHLMAISFFLCFCLLINVVLHAVMDSLPLKSV